MILSMPLAPLKRAPWMSRFVKFAPARSAPEKSAPPACADMILAPSRSASLKSANSSMARERSAPVRSAFVRSALRKDRHQSHGLVAHVGAGGDGRELG